MTLLYPLPLPANEAERLAYLRRVGKTTKDKKPALQALCESASRLFQVPIALVSLVEEHHQWFEARCGLSIDQTSREVSFCTHAIMHDEVMVVEDARLDDRFNTNPLVTGAQGVRFYAGAPLILERNIRVGTLCLIDTVAREFSAEDCSRLAGLAAVVGEILQLNLKNAEVSKENVAIRDEHTLLFDANRSLVSLKNRLTHWTRLSSDWIWETDRDHRFTFVEGDAETHRIDFSKWIGRTRWEVATQKLSQSELWTEYRKLVDQQKPIRDFCFRMYRDDGKPIVAEVSGDPVFDGKGEFAGYRGVTRDVTKREDVLKRLQIAELIARETKHAIIITDHRGRITWTNPAFTEITGYEPEEALGRTPGSLLQCSETSPNTVQEIRAALRAARGIRTEILNKGKDGRRYWLDLEIRPVLRQDGSVEGFIALENDVTDRVNEHNRKNAIFENATAGIVIHDEEGNTVDCNREAASILGLSRDQLLGRTAMDSEWHLVGQDERTLQASQVPSSLALQTGLPVRNQIVGVRRGDGVPRWLRANAQVFQVGADRKHVLVSFTDVTDEETMRKEASRTQDLLATIIETIPDAIAAFDQGDKLVLFNSAYREFHKSAAAAISIGADFSDIVRHGLSVGQFVDAGKTYAAKEQWLTERLEHHRKAGHDILLQLLDSGRWLQVKERRSDSGVTVGVCTDVTAMKLAEERIRSASELDHLTGLFNRSTFIRRFQNTARTNPTAGLAVALLDLDHFKELNDTLGHDVGDQYLIRISQRLVEAVRPEEVVSRLGGDEFAVMLVGCDSKAVAETRMQKLLQEVSKPLSLNGKRIEPQMSLGVALCPEDGEEVIDLLKNADIAMYERKKSGRNGVTVFEPYQKQQFARKAQIADCLRDVVRSGMLDVAFQGQVDLKTGRHTGFEALVRWNQPGIHLSPAEFIPIADEFGLSAELDAQILAKSLAQLRLLKDMGHSTGKVAVNLGTMTLRDVTLKQKVAALLQDSRLEPSDLEVEVTENVMIGRGHERVQSNLIALRSMGVSIALDDFGTGYASLTHLKAFPIDKIKIDRSFISEITQSESDNLIVSTLIALGNALGMKVIAEGVETEAQRKALSEYGCAAGQGYWFHRPETSLTHIDSYLRKFGGKHAV